MQCQIIWWCDWIHCVCQWLNAVPFVFSYSSMSSCLLRSMFNDCFYWLFTFGRQPRSTQKHQILENRTRDANVSSISHPHTHSASYRFTTLLSHSSVLGCNDIFLWKWIKNLYMNCARIASWRQRLWKAATRDHHHLAFRLHMANGITTIPSREFNTHTLNYFDVRLDKISMFSFGLCICNARCKKKT